MFELVLHSWKTSLSIFWPQTLKNGLVGICKNYVRVVKDAVQTLRWFLVADLCLTAILAEAVARNITSGPGFSLFFAITELNWFIIFGSIILLIRKRDEIINTKVYLQTMFFNYVQFLFIFMIFQLLFLGIVLTFGITQMPTLHWSIKTLLQIFELLIIFYWLDSSFRFLEFFSSTEKAANLILYNLPVFIIFFGLLMGLDYSLKYLFFGDSLSSTPLLLNSDSSLLLKAAGSRLAELKLILIKYSKLIFELFWLCILFAFYNSNKNTLYSKSIFEREENESD